MARKKHRNKRKQQQRQTPTPAKPKKSVVKCYFDALWKIISVVVFIFTVMQIVDYQFAGSPEITAENINSAEPFEARFLVKNRSWMTITNVVLNCMPLPLKANNNRYTIHGIKMVGLDDKISEIKPNQIKQFKCRIPPLRDITSINEAHILVSASYRKLYWPWETEPTEFTWFPNGDPPRWIEGEQVN